MSYAVTFDLDQRSLEGAYPTPSFQNAYGQIRTFLLQNGFTWTQGSVYFGHPDMNAVQCVLIVTQLSRTYPWFREAVRDIRMLRIEENNDLGPILEL